MGRRRTSETRGQRREQSRLYDADGRLTTDPAGAVRGEVVELDENERIAHRSRFQIEWIEIKWLPVSEPAFLLWVLAAFVLVWIAVAVWLTVF